MSELSEHDRGELERIELELMAQDPRLARLLEGFGVQRPRRRKLGGWLYVDIVLLTVLAVVPLLVVLAH